MESRLLLHTLQQFGRGDESVFDELEETRYQIARRERREKRWVDPDGARSIDRPDEIFSQTMVDADFASDRAVDLCEERRWELREGDAAQVRRRDKACRIADGAAAESEQRVVAREPVTEEPAVEALDGREALVFLALRHRKRYVGNSGASEARLETSPMEPSHLRLGDDRYPSTWPEPPESVPDIIHVVVRKNHRIRIAGPM